MLLLVKINLVVSSIVRVSFGSLFNEASMPFIYSKIFNLCRMKANLPDQLIVTHGYGIGF
jgi:hypothetical protein